MRQLARIFRPAPPISLRVWGHPISLRVWTAAEWAADEARPADADVDRHPNGCVSLIGVG